MLIKVKNNYLPDDITRLVSFYRKNPIIAANHLLIREGDPVDLPPIQQAILLDWWDKNINILTASRGAGKAQVHGSKVLTTNGFINIEDIKIGDRVITPNGNTSIVTGVYPQGKIDLFEIEFHDGRKAICSDDHLWSVRGVENSIDYEVRTLKDIRKWLNLRNKVKNKGPSIPLVNNLVRAGECNSQIIDLLCSRSKKGSLLWITPNYSKAQWLQSLVWRLGGVCKIIERSNISTRKKEYFIYIHLKNPGEGSLTIKSIKKVESGEATCIQIEDSEGLYITDNYVVTHNTFLSAVYISLKLILYPNTRLGIFGPAFRQSKLIFAEFEKFYADSPLLQECVSKPPTTTNEQASCFFKPAGRGISPSFLKALPVGATGDKIRGQRFSEFFMDECAQMPDNLFRSVIKPMISTEMNPMKKAREVEKLRKKFGDNIPPEMLGSSNGYTAITSGYYQFNYWWSEIVKSWEAIQAGSKRHSIRFVPWFDLPERFLDMDLIADSQANDPRHIYLTEWCADWIADSEGAFPMSLLQAARDENVIPKPCRDPVADKGKRFVFGIDVARERDATSIVVVELGYPSKVVFISELEEVPFPVQAKHILELIQRFEPFRICMDPGGGGKGIQDYLATPESLGFSSSCKVIPMDSLPSTTGKRILEMTPFSSEFIEDINNNTKTMLENAALKLPSAATPIEKIRKGSEGSGAKLIDLVEEMLKQTASIVISPTPTSGRLRYDLPKKSGAKAIDKIGLNARRKDLYTAFVLAGYLAYHLAFKPMEERRMAERGVIREIEPVGIKKTMVQTPQIPNRCTISNSDIHNLSAEPSKLVIPSGGIIVTRNDRRK